MGRVTWPSQKEVYATTIVVILFSVAMGVYLWVRRSIAGRGHPLDLPAFGAAHEHTGTSSTMTDDRTKQWYIVHTYSGFEER